MQSKTIIPFIHGSKKNEAKILIKETEHYPNAFIDFKKLVSAIKSKYTKDFPGEDVPNIQNQLLDLIHNNNSHLIGQSFEGLEHLGEYIFLNLDAFKGSEFNYINSVIADGQKIYV